MAIDNKVSVPTKGLVLDRNVSNVDPNSVTFALNASVDDRTGNSYIYGTEHGTDFITQLPGEHIGAINMERDQTLIFSVSDTSSYIGVLENKVYTTLIDDPLLNFSNDPQYRIRGEYRLLNGCDRVVYFIDGLNDDRSINLDKLEQYTNNDGSWNINEFKLQSTIQSPLISSVSVNRSGGKLKVGSYSFVARLLDEQLNVIATSQVSDQILIYDKNGAFNLEISTLEEGGVDYVNKSINVEITGIDTSYPYIKLIALYSTISGAVQATELDALIPASETVRYTVNEITGSRIDQESVYVDQVIYDTSKVIKIIDKRLVRKNVKAAFKDYSKYQRYSNSVRIKWTSKEITDQNKSEASFQSDEIYAFAIQYVHADGAHSPAFHIPGRAIDANDEIGLVVGTDINQSEVKAFGYVNGDIVPKWKVYSTADVTGKMGYYQSNETYPLTETCDDNYVFGSLIGKNVRYHRFPSKTLVTPTSKLGIEVSNVALPDDCIGYKILFSPRTQKTVVDGGIAFQNTAVVDGRYSYYDLLVGTGVKNQTAIITPKTLKGDSDNAEYISVLSTESVTSTTFSEIVFDLSDESQAGPLIDLNTEATVYEFSKTASFNTPTYAAITDQVSLGYLETSVDPAAINASWLNLFNIVRLEDVFPTSSSYGITYILKKATIQPYQNLFGLLYKPLTSQIYTDTATIFDGDIYVTPFYVNNMWLKGIEAVGSNPDLTFTCQRLKLHIESEIPFDLRVVGTDDNEVYVDGDLPTYFIRKIADIDVDNKATEKTRERIYEYYAYNTDFNRLYFGKYFLPIPLNYSYCSDCAEEFPNRIIWSNTSFSDESNDAFRIYLSENYTTVGTSPITAASYSKNRLIVRSTRSIYALTPNPQEINTDASSLYLGTGDFLSIPPAEINKVGYGFGGGQFYLDNVETDYGFVTVDTQAGQIFLFGDEYKELTGDNYGCQQWFKENLPVSASGYVTCGYDPRFKRLIVHKSDLIDGVNSSWTMSFSFKNDMWVSFHSYFPDYMFCNFDALYSANGDFIYAHTGDYQKYYGTKKDFVIEYVVFSPVTSDLDCIEYYAQTLQYDENNKQWLEKDFPTFDNFVIYTANQSTGKQTIIPKPLYHIGWSNTQKVCTHTERNYRISAIRDLSTGVPVMSADWNNIQSDYYIDKVPYNINYTQNQWQQIPIKDKYFKIRLFSNLPFNGRVLLNVAQSKLNQSKL